MSTASPLCPGKSRPNCKAAQVPRYASLLPNPLSPPPPRKLTNLVGSRNLPRLGAAARRSLHLHRQAGRTASTLLPNNATAPRSPPFAENAQEFKHPTRARHLFARHQLPLEVNAPASPLQRVPTLASHPWRRSQNTQRERQARTGHLPPGTGVYQQRTESQGRTHHLPRGMPSVRG